MIIFAVNIHTGGGKILLNEIIHNQVLGKVNFAFLDVRYNEKIDPSIETFYSINPLWDRLKAQLKLRSILKNKIDFLNEKILFFGNLPPFFKPKLKSILYLQNCFLTRQVPLPKDSYSEMFRNWIESKILLLFSKNVDEIWVQTEWMKTVTQAYLPKSKVLIKPILPTFKPIHLKPLDSRSYDAIYVGSFSLNKRLLFFIESLAKLDLLLDKEVSILIILDESSTSTKLIKPPIYKNIKIAYKFRVSRSELYSYYADSKLFIATSLYESFCLPLYEAAHYECKIIAPNAGYTDNLNFKHQKYISDSIESLTNTILTNLS